MSETSHRRGSQAQFPEGDDPLPGGRHIEHEISHDEYKAHAGRNKHLAAPDRNIVFEFTPDCLATQRLAH